MEWLLGRGDYAAARAILCDVFASQRDHDGGWPQWYMHPPFAQIASDHAHGDVPFWPILAAAQYLEASNDFAWLDEPLPYFDAQTHAPTHDTATVREHLERALSAVAQACLPDTALPAYGHGDWNDSLQPADPSLTHRMASGWTAGLYHMALRRLAGALTHHGEAERAAQLSAQADRVRDDFKTYVMKDAVAAGFYVSSLLQGDGPDHLLHPSDATTGVTYRLLPMIRGVLSELFTPDEAASHLALIKQHLLAPDGARLMDRPPVYRGGPMTHFQRSESASFFGREVGIMYVHAHLPAHRLPGGPGRHGAQRQPATSQPLLQQQRRRGDRPLRRGQTLRRADARRGQRRRRLAALLVGPGHLCGAGVSAPAGASAAL